MPQAVATKYDLYYKMYTDVLLELIYDLALQIGTVGFYFSIPRYMCMCQ